MLQGYKKNIIRVSAFFFMTFPWITYLKVVHYSELESSTFGSYNGQNADLFLYYKEKAVIMIAVFFVVWFLGEWLFVDKVDKDIPLIKGKNKTLFLLCVVFCGMVLLSFLFAKSRSTALWGSPNEREGMPALIGYIVLILVFYNYFANEYGMKVFKRAIQILSGITLVLSMIEFFYGPLLQNGFISKLAGIKSYSGISETGGIEKLGEAVSLSFYNPSYYGGFVCILLPFLLTFVFFAKKKKEVVINELLGVGMVFCIILSKSTTALYIAILEVVCVRVFCLMKQDKKRILFRSVMCLFMSIVAIFILSAFTDTKVIMILKNENSGAKKEISGRFDIEEIKMKDNSVYLRGKEADIGIIYKEKQIFFEDETGERILPDCEENVFSFSDRRYQYLSIELVLNKKNNTDIFAKVMVDAGYKDTVDFYILEDGTFSGIGQNGSIVKDIGSVQVPEQLKKYYGIFTGRGYAWLHSLSILKKTMLKGVGPGNFAFYFKQQDYVGMLRTHGCTKFIIDKPHNAYIQYAIQIGFFGMIAFFGIFLYVFVKSFRGYCKRGNTDEKYEEIQIGGMVTLIGFLLYSIINDGMITVTPIICMVAGSVLAAEYALGKKALHGEC